MLIVIRDGFNVLEKINNFDGGNNWSGADNTIHTRMENSQPYRNIPGNKFLINFAFYISFLLGKYKWNAHYVVIYIIVI